MNYPKLAAIFRAHESGHPKEHLTAHVVFTEDSFQELYPLLSRTYAFSSDNKAFRPNMGGYSIFGHCLDSSDPSVRLESYMAVERGGKGGWQIERCYILEQLRDSASIPCHERTEQEDGSVCYFFGDTMIKVKERRQYDGSILVAPLTGTQASCGEWVELELDEVAGYAVLLTRAINAEVKE